MVDIKRLSDILVRALMMFAVMIFFPLNGCYAASDEMDAVVFIVVGGIIIVGIFMLYSIYLQNRWKQLAQETGLGFNQKSQFSTDFTLKGKRNGRTVRINTFTIIRGSGKNRRHIGCVRVAVQAKSAGSTRFRLMIEGVLDKVGKAAGLQKEIEIGSPDFDKKFLIKADPDEREYIVEILNRKVQASIKKLVGIISPTHFFVNVSGAEVIFEYSKQADTELIKRILKAAEETAKSIEDCSGDDA